MNISLGDTDSGIFFNTGGAKWRVSNTDLPFTNVIIQNIYAVFVPLLARPYFTLKIQHREHFLTEPNMIFLKSIASNRLTV